MATDITCHEGVEVGGNRKEEKGLMFDKSDDELKDLFVSAGVRG